jgi:hypothetical protein
MSTARATAIFDGDDAGLQRTLGRINKSLGGMQQSFATAASSLGGLLGGGALIAGARSLGNFASEIRDLSDTTGLTTAMFQRYSFAVSQSGGSQEVFVKGLIAIQQAQQSALTGNEKAIASFAALGITLADLRRLSPDQIFLAFADAMKSSGGSAESFAAIAELVGVKVATKLVPSLKMGSDGLVELGKSASIASDQAIAAAEAAQDAWDKFGRDVKVIGLEAFEWFNKSDAAGNTAMRNALALRAKTKALEQSYVPMPLGFDPTFNERMGPLMKDFQPGVVEGFEQFGPSIPSAGPTAEEKAVADAREKAARDIYEIEQKIARLKLESGRDQMSQTELIASLEAERAGLQRGAASLSGSVDSNLRVMAAEMRMQAEEVGRRAAGVRARFMAGESTGEQFGPTLAELTGSRSTSSAASSGAVSKGGAGAGLWSSGGLVSGGAAYLARARGMGLGRPSSVTTRGGPQERMAADMRELLTLWKRG